MRLAAIAAGLFALLPAVRLVAQSDRSLTDSDNGILLAQGADIALPGADEETYATDVETLQERIILLRSTIKGLTESLAIAHSEAEVFKRQSADLKQRIEALGIDGLGSDPAKLEQRLLAAVSDLRLMKKQNEAARDELVLLTEAIQVLIQNAEKIDPQIRLAVETELRKTNEILGASPGGRTQAAEPTLTDGMVVDLKEDLSLVVANIGARQGVRLGMPFQVWRANKRVGEVRIVDVRERISGAVIQSLESEKTPIKTGDRLKVDAR